MILPQHLKFDDLVPIHKNITRVDGLNVNGDYQKTLLSQYSLSFATVPDATYEAIVHTEYLNYGGNSHGELDMQVEVNGKIISRSTMTGQPLTQVSRTLVGEFTASSTTTRLDTFIIANAARTISIYQGYLRVMRVG